MTSLTSSIATKLLIALTGLCLFLFLVMHLAGNLLVIISPEAFNQYAHVLISNPLLVPVELGLLALFLLHIFKAVTMYRSSRRARPETYQKKAWAGHTSRKSVASTTMIYSGLVTLLFVVLHVRTFKYGPHYEAAEAGVRDLSQLVVEVFSQPVYVGFYVICMGIIGTHLWHGFSSAFQSLGLDHPRYTPKILLTGKVLAIVIGSGFALIPLWVFFLGARS